MFFCVGLRYFLLIDGYWDGCIFLLYFNALYFNRC